MTTYDQTDDREQAAAWLDLLTGTASPGQTIELPVLSGSMAPLVPLGATLLVVTASWRETRDGDIVILREGTTLVAHRRLLGGKIAGRSVVYQKGDTNATGQWADGEQIVGLATGIRTADGARTDLTTATSQTSARHLARRKLAADLQYRLLAAPRRILAWLKTGTKNSD